MTRNAPWAAVKEGRMADAAATLNDCMQLIDLYARVSAPFIPDAADKMNAIFAGTRDLSWPTTFERRIPDGTAFTVPENLFARIDDATVAELTARYIPKKEEIVIRPIIARIEDVKNHPTREDLHILTVNNGTDNVQIVCGAPNVRVGMVGVLAPVGCKLPGFKKPLSQRTVAGFESFGMMCAAAELGIGDDDKNIIELDANAKIGQEYK